LEKKFGAKNGSGNIHRKNGITGIAPRRDSVWGHPVRVKSGGGKKKTESRPRTKLQEGAGWGGPSPDESAGTSLTRVPEGNPLSGRRGVPLKRISKESDVVNAMRVREDQRKVEYGGPLLSRLTLPAFRSPAEREKGF